MSKQELATQAKGQGGQTVAFQLLLTLGFGAFLAGNLGPAPAGAWTTAGLGALAWKSLDDRGGAAWTPRRRRRARLRAVAVDSLLWTSLAVAYWASGVEALRLQAFGILSVMMIVAQSLSFKSREAAVAFGVAPMIAFIGLPAVIGSYAGFHRLTLVICAALAVGYLILEGRRNLQKADAIRQAKADLEAQTQAAIAANEAKSVFLAMMSHELRTPMNGVLGMAHALTLTRMTGRQTGYVEMLLRSGKGLMAILNDILDISKIEAGRLQLETVPFDLHELAQRTHKLWAETAGAKGLRLVLELGDGLPVWVQGDPTRLRQVIANLVSNAIKFTSEGEVRLSLGSPAEGLCEIRVRDSGPGIPKSQQGRLFQSFSQADLSINRRFGGTGLGLSICRQLTQLMGGDIRVESDEGRGAEFIVSVPLAAGTPIEALETSAVHMDLTGLRILVADDNAINQAVARAILEALGANVSAAAHGQAALEQLTTEAIDVVLMDVHMPVMGGIEALKAIRSGATGQADQLVIALTADAMAGVDASLLAEGFDAVAPKPIDPAELASTILMLAHNRSRPAPAAPALTGDSWASGQKRPRAAGR